MPLRAKANLKATTRKGVMESHDAEFSDHGRTKAWTIAKAEPLKRLKEKGVVLSDRVIESLDAEKLNEIDSLLEASKKAKVILFRPSGKYYTEEKWEIPTKDEVIARGGRPGDSVGPYCMKYSKDFRRIGDCGAVLVDTQEPWGYPHLFPGLPEIREGVTVYYKNDTARTNPAVVKQTLHRADIQYKNRPDQPFDWYDFDELTT